MGAAAFIFWIACLILNIYLAKKKNRSVAAWVILSIFFSWIALIVLLVLRSKAPTAQNYTYTYSPNNHQDDTMTRSHIPDTDRKDSDDFIDVAPDKVSSVIKSAAKKTHKVATNCKACGAPIIGRHDQFVVCEYCGTGMRLDEDEDSTWQ